jgi:hypothetical protein
MSLQKENSARKRAFKLLSSLEIMANEINSIINECEGRIVKK